MSDTGECARAGVLHYTVMMCDAFSALNTMPNPKWSLEEQTEAEQKDVVL